MNHPSPTRGPIDLVLALSGAGFLLSLGYALFALASEGHAAFNTASNGVVWGLPVAVYVFFVLTSTGLTFVASLAMVFGFTAFYPIAKRCVWLALATLIAGFAALGLELGHPLRMAWAVPLNLQVASPMFWMGVFYAAYLVLLLLKFARIHDGDWTSRSSHMLGVLSFGAVIVAHATLGSVFGMMAMRPFWFGPLIPVYFLITAALSGAAFALLFTHLAYGSQAAMPPRVRETLAGPMPKVFAAALGVALVATLSRVVHGLWSQADGLQVWQAIVGGPWFWIEMAGLVAAFWMMLQPRLRARASVQVAAAGMTVLSLAIGRYEFVIGGQLVPVFKGSWVVGLVSYTPSLAEWMLALMAASITLLLYALGEKAMDLSSAPAVVPVPAEDVVHEGYGRLA